MLSEALQDINFKHDWRRTAARYRMFLYEEGQEVVPDPERGARGRLGFAEAEVEAMRETQGGDASAEGAALPGALFLRRRGLGHGDIRQRRFRA